MAGIFRIAERAFMPELNADLAAGFVNALHNFLPTGLGGVGDDIRHVRRAGGGRLVGGDAFGENEAYLAFRPAAVIGGDVLARHIAGRKTPRHGRHDNAVFQGQIVEFHRLKKNVRVGHDLFLRYGFSGKAYTGREAKRHGRIAVM